MIKNNVQLLNQLIIEIERTITRGEVSDECNIQKVGARSKVPLNYAELMLYELLTSELVNELGFLIQHYGDELLYFVNDNCPPQLISKAISTFVFEKEHHKYLKLQKALNQYIDLEDVETYRLADYLTLGHSLFDSLFYVYCYRIEVGKYNPWGLVSNTDYEKPVFLIPKKVSVANSNEESINKPPIIRA